MGLVITMIILLVMLYREYSAMEQVQEGEAVIEDLEA